MSSLADAARAARPSLSRFDLQNVDLPEVDFSSFLDRFCAALYRVFHLRSSDDAIAEQRGAPPYFFHELRGASPLSVFVPEEHGGRGVHPHECQAVLEAASYESLALSLAIGINGALFLQPLAKYGTEEAQQSVFRRVLQNQQMGGLMITEPDFGSDALSMQTSFEQQEDGSYRIQGEKHWAGLTGWADFWLVTARERTASGKLSRDIGFFVCDTTDPEQIIHAEEIYDNLGLYLLPYGRNRVDVRVPEHHRLEPHSTGIKMMLDLLHRSRMQFPGMGLGFLRRTLDEALEHTRERFVGGKPLLEYDQVKSRVARIQAAFTAVSGMAAYAGENSQISNDLSGEALPANSIKAVVTDLMQEASQSLLQLTGAKGYRMSHFAGRATVDSRPFQIFEGSNDILYEQITQSVQKGMRRMKETNLYRYLQSQDLTARASESMKDAFDFELDTSLPQRKMVELGAALGRLVTLQMALDLGDRGFRSDLVSNTTTVFRQDIENQLSSFQRSSLAEVIEDYVEGSSWLRCFRSAAG